MHLPLNEAIVRKRWGYEYLAYRNSHLAIWFLHIEHNCSTSLHCHCTKNTGLIVLNGIARISFLNNALMLKGLDKLQIFKGRFHSTTALSKNGADILEVEAPEDKKDLVRLRDSYGREGLGYEGEQDYFPKTSECLNIGQSPMVTNFANCSLAIENVVDKKTLIGREFEEVIVILNGGIYTGQSHQIICSPGDVIATHNLNVLLEKFDVLPNTQVLSIQRL